MAQVLDAKNGFYKLLSLSSRDDISLISLKKLNEMLNDFESIINDPYIDSVSYIQEKWNEFCKKHGKTFKINIGWKGYEFELRYEGMLSFYFYTAYSNDDRLNVNKFFNIKALKYILCLVEENIADVINIIYLNFKPKNEYFVEELSEAAYYYLKHKKNVIKGIEKISHLLNISLVKYRGIPNKSLLYKLNISIEDSDYKDKVMEILSYDIGYPPWFLDYIYSKMPVKVDAGFLSYLMDMAYLIMIALSTDVLDDDIGCTNIFLDANDIIINTKDNFAKIYDELSKIKDKLKDINMYILSLSLIPGVYKPYKKYDLPIEALSSIAFSIICEYIDVLIAVYYIYYEFFVISSDEFIQYIKEVKISILIGETNPILDILLNSKLPANPDLIYEAIIDILKTANAHKKVFLVYDRLFSLLNIYSFKLMFARKYIPKLTTSKLTMPTGIALPEFLPGVIEFKYVKDNSGLLDVRYTLLINNLLEHLLNIIIRDYTPPEEFTDSKHIFEVINKFLTDLYESHNEYVNSEFGSNYDIKLDISNHEFLILIIQYILYSNMKILSGEDIDKSMFSSYLLNKFIKLYGLQLQEEDYDDLSKKYVKKLIKLMYLINYYYGMIYMKKYNIDSPLLIKTEEDLCNIINKLSKNKSINTIPISDLMNLKYNIYEKYLHGRDLLPLYTLFNEHGPSLYQRLEDLDKYVEKQIKEINKIKLDIINTYKSVMNQKYHIKYNMLTNKISVLSKKLNTVCRSYTYYALLKSAILITYLYNNKEFANKNTKDILSHVGTKLSINIGKTLECIESKSYDLIDGLYGCYANFIGSLAYDTLSLLVSLTISMITNEYEKQLKKILDEINSGKSKSGIISIDMKQIFEEAIYKLKDILNTLITKLNKNELDLEEYEEEDDKISYIKNTLDYNFESAYELFLMYMMSDMILSKLIYKIVKSNISRNNVVAYANILKATTPSNYDAFVCDLLNETNDFEDTLEEWFKNIYMIYI